MRYLVAFLGALFLTGCCCPVDEGIPIGDELTWDTKGISKAVLVFSDKMKDEHIYLDNSVTYTSVDLRPIVWVHYHSQRLADPDAARRIIVMIVQGLLEELQKDAGEVMWTHHDLYVDVEFESFHGKYVDRLYVGRVELLNGIVSASYAHTALDNKSVVFHQHFEPYDSSLYFIQIEDQIAAEKPKKPMHILEELHEVPTETDLNAKPVTGPLLSSKPTPKATSPKTIDNKKNAPSSTTPKRPGWVE